VRKVYKSQEETSLNYIRDEDVKAQAAFDADASAAIASVTQRRIPKAHTSAAKTIASLGAKHTPQQHSFNSIRIDCLRISFGIIGRLIPAYTVNFH